MKKLLLIFHTIRHLRPIQIRYQLWYRLRRIWRKATGFNYPLSVKKHGTPVKLRPWIEKPVSLKINSEARSFTPLWFIPSGGAGGSVLSFTFLNIEKRISPPDKGGVSSLWRDEGVGKLWTYNLNYMDYLLQPGMDRETGIQLIENFIQNLPQNPTGIEPYPIALRGINWIKFLSGPSLRFSDTQDSGGNELNPASGTNPDERSDIGRERTKGATRQPAEIQQIDSSLYAQYKILLDNPEYHLLANHLLEDGFSLLFGAFYFSDQKLYNKGKEIVEKELEVQILDDGAHFELSPMYHQIILDRLLDGINLLQNNQHFNGQEQLLELMLKKAQNMLSWLNTITFSTGEIPLLNDSAPGIAPTTQELNKYATSLNFELETRNSKLSASGYRKFTTPTYECIIDIGQIGPSYQPGHAHADTLSFVLNVKNEPVLVDTGISTYDANETRLVERGAAAHNTVTVSEKNSSEVWSSFRVARRAKVKILKDDKTNVVAQHDGYKKMGATHQREWNFSYKKIEITDSITGKITEGKANLWFYPSANPLQNNNLITTKNATFAFENGISVNLIPAEIPNGYNRFVKTHKVEIPFKNNLKTIITQI